MDNEQLLRSAYAKFASGDINAYLALCTPDMTFTVPGRNPLAGTYDRDAFVSALLSDVMRLTNGTFRETIVDIYTNEDAAIVRLDHEFERDGAQHAYRTLHLYEIRDGRLASFHEVPEDLYAFDRAWS